MAKILEVSRDNEGDMNTQTVVKHVSDTMKDGSVCSPPALFRHTSMEKIRHCCQNLNLFPYLLYSFDNSKSHPLARKVNICLNHLITGIVERIFFLYKTARRTALRGISSSRRQQQQQQQAKPAKIDDGKVAREACHAKTRPDAVKPSARFNSLPHDRPKRKDTSLLLVIAIYLAPLIVCFQLLGLSSLITLGKYNPGFIFLIASLLFLGCIAIAVFSHESVANRCPSAVKCQPKQKVQ